jgi:predicted Holliday junction resolvase-like endonuclease
METSALLLAYFKDLLYIFGICPCCGEIFKLNESVIRINKRQMELPKFSGLLTAQERIDSSETENLNLEDRYHDLFESVSKKEDKFKASEKESKKKYHREGRRYAINRIKKIVKVFTRLNIDPRDIRLVWSPIEFISFNGMADEYKKEIDSIDFINHRPKSTFEEKTLISIDRVIKKGNIDFVLIRVSDKGNVTYNSLEADE